MVKVIELGRRLEMVMVTDHVDATFFCRKDRMMEIHNYVASTKNLIKNVLHLPQLRGVLIVWC